MTDGSIPPGLDGLDGFDFDLLDSFATQISVEFPPTGSSAPKLGFDVNQLEVFNKPISVDFQALVKPETNPDDPFGSILDALDDLIGDTPAAPATEQQEEEEEENPTIKPEDEFAEYGVFTFGVGVDNVDEEYSYFMQSELRLLDDSVFEFIDQSIEASNQTNADPPSIPATLNENEITKASETPSTPPTSDQGVTLILPDEEQQKESHRQLTRHRSVNTVHQKRQAGSVGASSAPRPQRPSGSPASLSQSHSPGRESRRRSSSDRKMKVEKDKESSSGSRERDRSHSPSRARHSHHGSTVSLPPGDDNMARTRMHSIPAKQNPFTGKKVSSKEIIKTPPPALPPRDTVSQARVNARKSFIEKGTIIMGNVLPLKTEPLLMENLKLFRIAEEDMSQIPSLNCQLYWKENFYKTRFHSEVHLNYYGVKDQTEFTIVSIDRMPSRLGYNGCKTDKRGSFLFTIPLTSVEVKKTIPVHQALNTYLSSNAFDEGITYNYIDEPEFGHGLIQLEEKHKQNPLAFKIAVLYSVGTETSLQDFFNHKEASDSFWEWINLIGRKIELDGWKKYRGDFVCSNTTQQSYYKEFGNIEIMYHIALWMDAEQHRRLIGNDVVFFVFHNSEKPFNPMGLDGLGTVPQVFFVIQQVGTHYRTSVFTRPNIKDFAPKLFFNTSFAPDDFVKVLLTKAYNGFCTAVSCPPMNRLFEVPRREAINELVKNYIDASRTRVVPKEVKDRKEIIRTIELAKGTQLLITVMKARDLPGMDTSSASDPFCQIRLANQVQKTKVKKQTLTPEWNEQLVFSSYFIDPCHHFTVEVWDWNQIFAAVFMGSIHLSLRTFCTNLENPRWFPLYGESNTLEEKRGEILLRFQLVGPGARVCPACHILIGSTDSVDYPSASYHTSCVKCQDCFALLNGPSVKRLKKENSQQKRDIFFCNKHWEAHALNESHLDPEVPTFEYRGNFKNKNKPTQKK